MSTDELGTPAADEIEVSVFGPGVGECVVVHLGSGAWIVVDSCLGTTGGRAVAIEYLDKIGVDVATAVKMVVVTHWHDDHINGISELFAAAKSATLVWSMALHQENFVRLVRLVRNTDSKVDEFGTLFNELTSRLSETSGKIAAPVYAIAGRSLLQLPSSEVTALSPSDVAIAVAQVKLSEEFERRVTGPIGRRVVAQEPNEAAVVLWVKAGAFDVLLGSDLEESKEPRDGWQAIVTDHSTAGRSKSQLFKVAHHGSVNGHSDGVWSSMLVDEAHAALTPFRRSKLPQKADLERIRTRTGKVFLTANPESRKPPRREPAVDRTMAEVAKRRTVVGGKAGHLRFRAPLAGGEFQVALFDGAYQVA